jgi:hypothetical protein
MRVKINGTELDALIQTRPGDSTWGGRESKAISFAATYEEAMELFSDGVPWSVVYTNPEDGQEMERDLSEFALAGPVTDNRNGTVTVKMGKYLDAELLTLSLGEIPGSHQEAVQLRTAIETASQSLDDNVAARAVALFPRLKCDGSLIKAGTRIQWKGKVIRAKVDLWDREDHSPENAPTLWEGV